MLDRNGLRILWGWITEARPDAELIAAGWAGTMSLPRILSLSPENELQTEVAPEVEMLRSAHIGSHEAEMSTQNQRVLGEVRIHNLAGELDLHLHPKLDEFTLRLQSDAGEFASISCANQSGSRVLRINQISCPLPGATASSLRLHMFLDGSVLEIFANDSATLTARVYQVPQGPLRLRLEGDVKVAGIDVWQVTPISKDRLTGSLCSEKSG